jgi:prepilin-type N-terminal cleavage/methylation domain-containing protein
VHHRWLLNMKKRGFTLIELLVSVAIFSIVMVMALGALLSLSVAARKAASLKTAIDNLSFGIDSMARAIRTGQNYHCGSTGLDTSPRDCAVANGPGDNYLTFLAAGGVGQVYYQLDTTNAATCGQAVGSVGCIERKIGSGGTWIPITSPDIIVSSQDSLGNLYYLFHVIGSPTGDGIQPQVIITINGVVQVTPVQTTVFHLQTAVTQRIYDQ